MEMQTREPQTDLRRNPADFAQLATQIREIGIGWVATASGYNPQTVKNYLSQQQGSQRLENRIVASLSKASELKLQSQQAAQQNTLREVIRTSRQQTREALKINQQELEKIDSMLDHFEQTVVS